MHSPHFGHPARGVVALLVFALLGIWPLSGAHAAVRIVATVGDLAAVAREVAGPQGEVTLLVRPQEDPHFVDARPSYIRELARADVILHVGADLEVGWLPTLLQGSRNARLAPGAPGHFDASRAVQIKEAHQAPADRSQGDVHPGGNPHFSTDPRQMARVALALGRSLGQIEPAHAEAFAERARQAARSYIREAQRWEEAFAALPAARKRMVTYHNAWVYVADWLGLEVVGHIEPKPGIAPNPRHVAALAERIRSQGVPLIAQMEYYPGATGRVLAERTGARLVLAPAQTRENQTYAAHIAELAHALWEVMAEGTGARLPGKSGAATHGR